MKAKDHAFKTEIRVVGDTLTDTNATPDPSDDVEFMRLSDESELLDDARTSVESYLRLLDRGDIDGFYSNATSETFRKDTSAKVFRERISSLQQGSGLIDKRRYLLVTHIRYAPMISKEKGNYVLFSNMIHSNKNLTGVEFLLLTREGTAWKIYWINYGS